jgi:hypothetical protein
MFRSNIVQLIPWVPAEAKSGSARGHWPQMELRGVELTEAQQALKAIP